MICIALGLVFISGIAFSRSVDNTKIVELSVNITEVNSRDLKELGVKWFNRLTVGESAYMPNIIAETGVPGWNPDPLKSTLGLPSLIGASDIRRLSGFWFDILLLADAGNANIIATPRLTIQSGRQSSMLIGGEFPIVVKDAMGGATVEYKKFGTILEVGCIAYTDDTLDITVTVERSSLEEVMPGTELPILSSRNVSLSVSMRSGDTLNIAGLSEKQIDKSGQGIPFLMDIPVLGYLFKWERNVVQDMSVLVMITPRIIERD
jgi:pilus assembly protein CpaC